MNYFDDYSKMVLEFTFNKVSVFQNELSGVTLISRTYYIYCKIGHKYFIVIII